MSKIRQGDIFNFVASLGYTNKEIVEEINEETDGRRHPTLFDISRIRSNTKNGYEGLNASWWYEHFVESYLDRKTDESFETYEGTDYERNKEEIREEKKKDLFEYVKEYVDDNDFDFEGKNSVDEIKEYIIAMFACGLRNYRKREENITKNNPIKISQSDIKPPKDFKGRKDIIEKVKFILDKERAVVLRGIGGIGKTFIAKQYANSFEYECKQLIICQKSFASYKQLLLELRLDGITEEKFSEEEKINNRIKLIKETKEKTLLIFDNVDKSLKNNEIISDLLSSYNNVHMIFTTRSQERENIATVIDINTLSKEEQRELFETHLKQKIEEDDEEYVEKILEKVAGHTFLIELAAKSVEAACYDYKKIYDYLNREDSDNIPEITAKKDEKIIQDVKLKEMVHILLFDIGTIEDEKEKEALCVMSLLPLSGIQKKLFGELFVNYRKPLHDLQNDGWIKEEEQNDRLYISIHPIICDVVRDEYEPTFSNCFDVVNLISNYIAKKVRKGVEDDLCKLIINIMDIVDIQKDDYSKEKVHNLKSMAEFLRNNYKYEEALSIYRTILEICRNGNADNDTFYNVYQGLGELNQRLANYSEAITMFENAIECATENSKKKAKSYRNLGEVYRKNSDYKNAEAFDQAAIDIYKKFEDTKEAIAEATNALGVVYINRAEAEKEESGPNETFLNKALEKYQEAFGIWKEIDGPIEQIAFSKHNIGTVYFKLKKIDKALEYHLEGLKIREENDLDETYIGASYAWLCKDYAAQGNAKEAKECINKSLDIREKRLGKDHPDYAWALDSKSDMFEVLGEYDEAISVIEEVIKIRVKALGMKHEYTKQAVERLEKLKEKRETLTR